MDNIEAVKSFGFTEMKGFIPSPWWTNRESRMAFNYEGVSDADGRWLQKESRESVNLGYFVFYFGYGTTMDGRVCGMILEKLRLSDLVVEMRMITPAQ